MSIRFGVCGCCGCKTVDKFNRTDINTPGLIPPVYTYTVGQWTIKRPGDDDCPEEDENTELGVLKCLSNDAIIHFDKIAAIHQSIYVSFGLPKIVGAYAKIIYGSHNIKVIIDSNTAVKFYLDNILIGIRKIYDISSIYGGFVYGGIGIEAVKESCMQKSWNYNYVHINDSFDLYLPSEGLCVSEGSQPFWGQNILQGFASVSQTENPDCLSNAFGGSFHESYTDILCKPLQISDGDIETTSYALQASNGVKFTNLTIFRPPDCDESDSDGDGIDDGTVNSDIYDIESEGGDAKANCHRLAKRGARHMCWPDDLPDELQIEVTGFNCTKFGYCQPNDSTTIGECGAAYFADIAQCGIDFTDDIFDPDDPYDQCICTAKRDYYDCACNIRHGLRRCLDETNTIYNGTYILERIDCPDSYAYTPWNVNYACQSAMWSGDIVRWDGRGPCGGGQCQYGFWCETGGEIPAHQAALSACELALGAPPYTQSQIDTYTQCCKNAAFTHNVNLNSGVIIVKLSYFYNTDGTGSGAFFITQGNLGINGAFNNLGATTLYTFSLEDMCNGQDIFTQTRTIPAGYVDNTEDDCECGAFNTEPPTVNGVQCWTRSYITNGKRTCPEQNLNGDAHFII